eukprot:12407380-Karenia_brevis.AAC.1
MPFGEDQLEVWKGAEEFAGLCEGTGQGSRRTRPLRNNGKKLEDFLPEQPGFIRSGTFLGAMPGWVFTTG